MGKVFVILLMVLGIWVATEFAAGTSPFAKSESRSKRANVAAEETLWLAKQAMRFDFFPRRVELVRP